MPYKNVLLLFYAHIKSIKCIMRIFCATLGMHSTCQGKFWVVVILYLYSTHRALWEPQILCLFLDWFGQKINVNFVIYREKIGSNKCHLYISDDCWTNKISQKSKIVKCWPLVRLTWNDPAAIYCYLRSMLLCDLLRIKNWCTEW